jgi:hypothetical protein
MNTMQPMRQGPLTGRYHEAVPRVTYADPALAPA